MQVFLNDYEQGKAEGRYVDAELPTLPFADKTFDIALCSHLLFVYSVQLISPRTMYRLLDTAGEIKERRAQVRRPHYAAPELLATRPNEVWSWDITKLLGPAKWTYFYLYVILDIFSRYVVGWMLAPPRDCRPGRAVDRRDLCEACHSTRPTHDPRGPRGAMRSKPVALLLAALGVTKTHSTAASAFSRRPSCTSATAAVRASRQQVLAAAYAAHPERFVKGRPHPADLPSAVWINPPVKKPTRQEAPGTTIVPPVDLQHPPISRSNDPSAAATIDLDVTLISSPLVSQCH
jgi:hypothetical protein